MEKLTVVIPNRNRDLRIVKNSLDSIQVQLVPEVMVTVVDYGSEIKYQDQLQKLISNYKDINLLLLPTQGQLWNKSRCINIVLKQTKATHLFVSDMDLIWHPDFLKSVLSKLEDCKVFYFQIGFMTQEESNSNKGFDEKTIKFKSTPEATGVSLFPVERLLSVNGFDEFYHGWGGEDTDIHIRLRNAKHDVEFYNDKLYFKHQWHEKGYRELSEGSIFHTQLEKINHKRINLVKQQKSIKVNLDHFYGMTPFEGHYLKLSEPELKINVDFQKNNVIAALAGISDMTRNKVIEISFQKSEINWMKKIKNILIPKLIILDSVEVNDLILQEIVIHYRNTPYFYKYSKHSISLKLFLCNK